MLRVLVQIAHIHQSAIQADLLNRHIFFHPLIVEPLKQIVENFCKESLKKDIEKKRKRSAATHHSSFDVFGSFFFFFDRVGRGRKHNIVFCGDRKLAVVLSDIFFGGGGGGNGGGSGIVHTHTQRPPLPFLL